MRAFAILLALALVHASAVADDSPAVVFAAGLEAYEAGNYTTAIAAFEDVFRRDPRAEVAFTLAQAHRNQYFIDRDITHLQRALGLYRHYLAEEPTGRRAPHARLHLETIETILASLPPPVAAPAPPAPTQLLLAADAPGALASVDGGELAPVPRVVDAAAGAHRIHVEAPGYDARDLDALAVAERLVVVSGTLHARPATLVVRVRSDASILVDDRPTSATTELSAGTHRVTITARGHEPVVREIQLAAGATETVDITLRPTTRRHVARWTLAGAAVLAGGAAIAGGLAYIAQHDAEAIPAPPARMPGDLDAYADAIDRRDTWRHTSIGFGVAALATTAAGVALYWFDTPVPGPAPHTVVPVIGPESVGAALVGRF